MPPKPDYRHSQRAERLLLEPGVFQQLYDRSHLAVFRYIYALHGGPVEEVEDLTTTTFLRAWKSRRRFRGDLQAATGWLFRIARNLVIDAQRRSNRRPSDIDIDLQSLPAPGLTPEESMAHQEQVRTLWVTLAQLPDRDREIIILRYILGWRVKEIATHLDLGENHVSVLIRRILANLKQIWVQP